MSKLLSISASSSSRWMECTASPKFILDNKDKICEEDTSSVYAEEGTLAHEIAAEALILGFIDESEIADQQMAQH